MGFIVLTSIPVGAFYGPVDLGIHLAYKHNSLNVGAGLLAGSVFPGSNRLIFTGISPSWHGFLYFFHGWCSPGVRQPGDKHVLHH
jgi:glyceraldehyde-3-phosphate dehydrogenase (ferredoxin)